MYCIDTFLSPVKPFGGLLLAQYAMVVDCRVSRFGRSLLRMIYWYLFYPLVVPKDITQTSWQALKASSLSPTYSVYLT